MIGENPAQSDADAHHVEDALGGLDHLVVQEIFLTRTAEFAHVVLPAAATWCEGEGTVTNSERRVQRVRKAIDPPAGAKDELWIISRARAGGWATTGASRRPKQVWNEFRVVAPHFAGGMSYARLEALGGIQWPCPDESHPGETFLHGRLWQVPCGGRPAPFSVVHHDPPVEQPDAEYPLLLTTGRRLESYNTGVQTGGYDSPLHFGETLDISPEDAARLGIADGDTGARRSSRRGQRRRRRRASTRRFAPGMVFMTLHFPDEVATNRLTIDVVRSEVGHGRVQGLRRARRAACARHARELARCRRDAAAVMDIRRDRRSTPTERGARGDRRAARSAAIGVGRRSRAAVARDAHVATVGGRELARERHLLLPALQALQARVGWISEGGLGYVCERLNVPPAEAWGVATFYALLATSPRPQRVVHVCDDIACKCRGADELIAERSTAALGRAALRSHPTTTRRDSNVATTRGDPASAWMRSPCLGKCEQAPAAFVTDAGERPREALLGHVTADGVRALRRAAHRAAPWRRPSIRQTATRTSGCCAASAASIRRASTRIARPAALPRSRRRARSGAAAVIAEVTASKLMGRGGAAFPTGRKWEAVRTQPATPHYLVCNADESEPGTFKDRVLMEEDPFAIVEAMAIAAFATGCAKGFVYIRGEYPLAAARLQHAIDASRAAGLLGRTSTSRSAAAPAPTSAARRPPSSSRSKASAASRATSRRFPCRSACSASPPSSTTSRRSPTCRRSCSRAARPSRRSAPAQSTGTRLFCLSGSVQHPGVYEAPFGITLRVADRAGGRPSRRAGRCAPCCSAAPPASFVRPDEIDLPLTHEDTRAAGTTLGSGVVMVVRRHGRSARPRAAHRRRSSATSRAASACRAASARSARRRRCIASPRRLTAGGSPPSSRCSTKSAPR